MEPPAHGYTNLTRRRADGTVEKRYQGPRRAEQARREHACLLSVGVWLPVPLVLECDMTIPRIVLSEVVGRHGQELVDEGHARAVLRLLGDALSTLQQIDRGSVPGLDGDGTVLVHGDFGPQNVLFTPSVTSVTAILDWEFAHLGDPIEDLAWTEWIIRMHHRGAIDALDDLFGGFGTRPPWRARHEAMVRRCGELARADSDPDVRTLWRDRTRVTERWTE